MKIIQIDQHDSRQVKAFLSLPFRIYADYPQWVPPLAGEAHMVLNREKHPFYRHSEAAFFLAENESGMPTGRLAILDNKNYNTFNQERTAFFYLFECENDIQSAVGLFEAAIDWGRRRNLNKIFGPKGFSVFDGLGLLIKGFEYRPAFGIPYNPDYYATLLASAGFQPAGDMVSGYLSTEMVFPERLFQLADLIKKRRGLQIVNFRTRNELRQVVPQLKDLYNRSLAGTTGNVPLTDEEVNTLAAQMLWFADPKLIKFVMKNDQLVGFLFAYPDISAAVQRSRGKFWPLGWADMLLELRQTQWININGAGIIEEYRGLGGTALLFTEMYKSVVGNRYKFADLVQIGVENDRMQRELRGLGVDFYKTHRMYQRDM